MKPMPDVILDARRGKAYRTIEIDRQACEHLQVVVSVYTGTMELACANRVRGIPCMPTGACPLRVKSSGRQTHLF